MTDPIEAMAKAVWDSRPTDAPDGEPWEKEPESVRQALRGEMAIALLALGRHTPNAAQALV